MSPVDWRELWLFAAGFVVGGIFALTLTLALLIRRNR
jgi:hypothetical protein